MTRKTALTGSRPTAQLTIGNYFGALLPLIEMQKDYQTYFFLADYHALNSMFKPEVLRKSSYEMIATMIALGYDTEKNLIYSQSCVPQTTELMWILACQTPYASMLRSVAFKDAQAKGNEVNMGIFNYPILMAADILLYQADVVPIGPDQDQHLEIARDLAQKFNFNYKEFFKVPKPIRSLSLIKGTDGESKMSKSYGNYISIFAEDKTWKKQIMAIKTDSKGLEDKKNPDECLVYYFYSLFASPTEKQVMREKYEAGGYGYGHAKLELLEKVKESLSDKRDAYSKLLAKPTDLEEIIRAGSKNASEKANETLESLKSLVGLVN